MTQVTEVAADVYRISTFAADFGMQFNQFLLMDDEPFLFHAGLRGMFRETKEAVTSVVAPERLRWIGFSHFESDECGALNDWLAIAPRAEPVCSFVGAMVNVNDFASRPARALADGEVLSIGGKKMRFLATPHVPHGWDAGLFFEERDRTLFCSDLFFHPGNPKPVTDSDIVGRARDSIREGLGGPLAHDIPYSRATDETLDRLAALSPHTLALMHGSSFSGDGSGAIRLLSEALRDLLGRNGE